MLEEIIQYQNNSERNFKKDKSLWSFIHYSVAFTIFITSTLISIFTLPLFLYHKIFPKKGKDQIIHPNDTNFETVLNKEPLILIDFWAE